MILNYLKKIIRVSSRSIIIIFGKAFHNFNGIPVIYYHSIDEEATPMSINQNKFHDQMTYLYNNGYNTIQLQEIPFCIEPVPQKTIGICFDDGFASVYEIAMPILRKYTYSATVFITTDFIGKRIIWPNYSKPQRMLDKYEINYLSNNGFEIGAHGTSHNSLTKISLEKQKSEIELSKQELEKITKKTLSSFCYPNGQYNRLITKIVKNVGYSTAWTINEGYVSNKCDLYTLPRLHINSTTSSHEFRAFLSPLFMYYLKGKNFLRFSSIMNL